MRSERLNNGGNQTTPAHRHRLRQSPCCRRWSIPRSRTFGGVVSCGCSIASSRQRERTTSSFSWNRSMHPEAIRNTVESLPAPFSERMSTLAGGSKLRHCTWDSARETPGSGCHRGSVAGSRRLDPIQLTGAHSAHRTCLDRRSRDRKLRKQAGTCWPTAGSHLS